MLTSTIGSVLFLVELKTRCISSTEIEAKGLVQRLCQKCTCISWDNPRLSKVTVFTHELVQCFHHATIHDLNCVLLLIGDRSSRTLVGIWIKYDAMIKAARQRFLDVAYVH